MTDDALVPPVELIFDGATSQCEFKEIGEGFVSYFLVQRAKLTPSDTVVDVGCGIGQKARPLTKYLNARGTYEGFGIVRSGIEWCQEHYKEFANFHFQLADIGNTHYNPAGRRDAREYRFPYQDAVADVVFLSSVFTHMLPAAVSNYFNEISRVLRPSGRCVITFFLLNQESLRRMARGLNSIEFPHLYGTEKCRVADLERPETTVAHDETFIRDSYEANGLSITEISYGSWCGRKELLGSLHDVVIAVKEVKE